MKLSIVTPSYGQAKFLETTILSVLNATRTPDEYFVIDGGSTDGSLEIILRYADRLTGWASEPDKGQADAINKGFARCHGDVLGWLNSDDVIEPNTFERVLREFEADSDLVLLYGDVNSIDAEGLVFHRQAFKPFSVEHLACFQIISQPAVFFRRSAFEKSGGLDPSYRFLLDHHLWLRVALCGSMKYIPEVLARARYHAGAKNIAESAGFGAEALRIAAWLRSSPEHSSIYAENQNAILAGAHSIDCFYQVEAKRPLAGLRAFFRAARHDVKSIRKNARRALLAIFTLIGLGNINYWARNARKKTLNG